MKEPTPPEEESGLALDDILFILFRQKWKIILSSTVGIVSAALFYHQFPLYESKAKLIVRYVVERSAVDKVDSGPNAIFGMAGESIMNAEMEILTSADLARQVASSVGVKRLLPQSKEPTLAAAAGVVGGGLKASAKIGSNVIQVSYANKDPETAKRVLESLVSQYFDKHLQVHRSLGAFDFVMKQTESFRLQLYQTEEELKQLKSKAGVVSPLAESATHLNDGLVKSQDQLDAAEVEQAEQRARVTEIEKWVSGGESHLVQQTNSDGLQEYQSMRLRLEDMRRKERDLLSRYTDENQQVKVTQAQIGAIEARMRDLEKLHPGLTRTAATTASPSSTARFDLLTEKARLASMDAKTQTLSSQLRSSQEKAERVSDLGSEISALERKRDLEEANYKYFEASLEKARVDEALDPSKIPNISIVQNPTDAQRDLSRTGKIALGMAAGGVGFGLILAFLIELVFDRTIKRPIEIESRLHLPLLMSIPHVTPTGNLALPLNANGGGPLAVRENAARELGHQIHPYFQAIRDRLVLYFELNRMKRKPKLVAVTGLSKDAGVSTVAGGLAAALSETGDGKVLLVNMNVGEADLHPFFDGKDASSLTDMLNSENPDSSVAENLYLATVASSKGGATRFAPKRFYDLIPTLKASYFDYIIFDMPPLTQTSTTVALAGFMDKVLVVVEEGVSNPDVLVHAYKELVAAKADVACVFNKARSQSSKGIEGEI